MRWLKAQHGWSYVEILMAALLLSIITVPILLGFHQTALNFSYAHMQYHAALMASNAISEGKRELQSLWLTKSGDLSGFNNFTQTPEFEDLYKTDIFQYTLNFELIGESDIAPPVFISTFNHSGPNPFPIDLAGDNQAVFVEGSASGIQLMLNHDGEETIFFDIYLEEGLSPEDVNVTFGNNRGSIIVQYQRIRRTAQGLLTVEISDINGRPLITKSTPVFLG